MVYKFGEIYIYHDQNEEYFINSLYRFFDYETFVDNKSRILMIFNDNNELFDVKEYLDNINKTLFNEIARSRQKLPILFILNNDKKATRKKNIISDGIIKQNFKKIFIDYKKYNTFKPIPSIFNCIYEHNLEEIFGILRVSSADDTPKFIFAFDDKFMDNQQVVCLINDILRDGK